MRKFYLLSTLVVTMLLGKHASAQDFSNKGTDFWVAYGYTSPMTQSGNSQNLVLYFAAEQATNVNISIPALAYSQNVFVAANSVATSVAIPKTGAQDARLTSESTGPENKGIHITSDHPVVAYAHDYNGSCSGATILFPTPTLGKEYYSINYENVSNTDSSNSWAYVIAVDPGTTTVEITPSVQTIYHPAGVTFTIDLAQGQVYQIMGKMTTHTNPFKGFDLTGTHIRSIAGAGGGCKRIAVFSGSGRISIICPNTGSSSSDNYMVQALPKSAWGKKFLTVSSANYQTNPGGPHQNNLNDIYRICVADPTTVVQVNGAAIAVPLQNNFYYEIAQTSAPMKIEADQPITVAQYFTSQGSCGNPATTPAIGDPEVIYLSPVEQSISKVFWNATPNNAINANEHFINVIIPNTGTAISSFKLKNAAGTVLANNPFTAHPQDPNYSYLKQRLPAAGVYSIESDTGFNAIAYGFGNAESYGYNAGTNVRDLNSGLEINNEFGIETYPNACTNSPFKFKIYLPDKSNATPPVTIRYDSIRWDCSNVAAMNPANFPYIQYGAPLVIPDSVNVRNGKDVAWYSVPGSYTFITPGVYTITITVYRTSSEGCGNSQEYTFPLTVTAPPVADFTFSPALCTNSPIQFNDATPFSGSLPYKWWWDFGDPPSGAANASIFQNPTHIFSNPGTYTVKFSNLTRAGCFSDTASKTVEVTNPPTANFTTISPNCINTNIQFNDASTLTGSGTITQWVWDFGDPGSGPNNTSTLQNPSHTFATAGTFTVSLIVKTNTNCASTPYTFQVVVRPDATITLSSAPGTDNQTVCINTPITNITYTVGGSGNGGNVTGLPTGLSGTFAGGVITISGTPTVSGTFNYIATTLGPCVNPSANGTITITPDGTISLTSPAGSNNQTVCINTPLAAITYAVGGSGNGGNVTGLPAGVTGVYAGGVITISGTPSVSGTFNYTVNTTGPCVTPNATGTITVTADGTINLTSAPGTNNQTKCINIPITNITYAVGGTGNGGSVTGLPTGVTGVYAGGVITISGTPTVSGTFNYTVTTTGPCVTPSATGTITVTADGTITLTSPAGSNSQTVCINTPLASITYAVGGSGNGGSVTGLPAGVTGVYAGGVITINGTPTVSGTFNYTVNTTGPCVTPNATGTITVTPDATITLTSAPGTNNQTKCINTPITNITYAVGGSGNGGSVTGLPAGVTGVYAGGVITISGTPTVSGTFNYTVNTTGPCVTPNATGTITITPDATVTLTSGAPTTAQELCVNSTLSNITYAVGASGNGGNVTGLPAGVTGIYAGGVITISGAPTVSGTFNYTVTATGPCQPATATGTIIVNPLPTSNFNFTVPSCETRTISFTDISVPNAGNINNWQWNFGDPGSGPLNTSALQNPSHTYSAAGSYMVSLIVTTDKGCVSIQPARQVTINTRPQAGFIVPDVCINDVATLFTDTSHSVPANSWDPAGFSWNFGDPGSGAANTSTSQNGTHLYTAIGPYLVTHVVTTLAGCKDTIQHTIFINAADPVADFTINAPANLCANDSIGITNRSTVSQGNVTKLEIYWDVVGAPATFQTISGPVANGLIIKHKYPTLTTSRNYSIKMIAYSGTICFTNKVVNITVNAAPAVQFLAMPTVCFDAAPFQITQASETGGVTGAPVYSGPGVSPGGIFTPSAVVPGSTNTIKYLYIATAGGCRDSATQTITVWDTASAKITVAPITCEKNAIAFGSGTSTIPAGAGTITGWNWNFGDPPSGPLNTSTSANPSHTYNTWGNYTVSLQVSTSNNCKSTTQTIPVKVNPLPVPDFALPPSACLPSASVVFNNNTTMPDGSTPTGYLWNFGDPASGPNNTSTASSPTHIYNTGGPFTVSLQVTSNAGCVNSVTKPLTTIHPQPLASFDVDKIDVCIGGSFNFSNTSNPLDGVTTQYNWTMDDGNVRNIPAFNYTYNTVGTYNVSLYILNSNGCRSTTAVKTVYVNPFPAANAGPDKFMLEGGQVELTPVLVTNMNVSYSWAPVTYLNNPNISNPIATPPDDITYTLTVTSDKGCTATDKVFIKVLKKPAIPNIFSPNGDGVHDTWVIQYLESYPGCTVDIYNRYGQHIFHSEGYTKPWDGTVNGKTVPVGTYYYIVDPKNGRKQIAGYVDVIR